MKKRIWLLMILLAVLVCSPVAGGAEEMAELYPSLSQTSGVAGDEVTLYLYLTAENVGGLQTTLTWNSGYLTYVEGSAAFSTDFAEKALVSMINDDEDGKIRLAYGSTEGYTGSWSEVFSARFILNEDVVGGTYFELTGTKVTDATADVNSIPVSTGSAYIYTEIYNAGQLQLYPSIIEYYPLIGDMLTVNLYASASDTLGSVQGTLVYDPKVLAYVEGSAVLSQAYVDSAFTSMVNDEVPGEIRFVYASTTGCNEYQFATVQFEVIGGVNSGSILETRDVKATNTSTEHLALMNAYGSSAWFNPQPIPNTVYYTLYSAETEALCGSTISVAIQADGPALGGMQATLTYDVDKLTYVADSAAFTDAFAEKATIAMINDGTAGQIKLVYANAEGFDPEDSDIFTAKFVAKQPSLDSLQLTSVKTTDASTAVPAAIDCEAQIGQLPMVMHDETVDAEVPPTCTNDGLSQGYHCAGCGEVTQPQEWLPATGHWEEYIYPIEPTCTAIGWTDGWRCMTCGETLTAPQEVPAWGHSESTYPEIAPTCTENGWTAWSYCMTCGETLVAQQVIPALGHSEAVDAAVVPTCTATGLTEGKHCSVCGETLVAQQVIPALGHSEAVDAAVAPTCTATGLTEGKHCSVCGETLVAQQVVPALGHSEVVDAAVAPTCTATGLTEGKHCSVCGETLIAQQVVPALGHKEVVDAEIPATHMTTGLTEGKHCATCGEVLMKQQVIPMVQINPVILSAQLLSIDEDAFEGSGIECINLPEKCQTIKGGAFAGCKVLRFIYIPASVTSIADDAFDGSNAALIIVTTAGSQAEIFAQEHDIVYVLKK